MIIYYIRTYIKAIKSPKLTHFALINLFRDGLGGVEELVQFIFLHVLYLICWITYALVNM